MVTIDGINIFGVAVGCETSALPRAEQLNQYPGVDGKESLDMGDRGRMTRLSGRLYGPTAADLGAAFALLDSYRDGRVHVLYDGAIDVAYANVKLIAWQPTGRVAVDPDLGYTRRYVATLEHLTSS